jgi:hypothetical protein
MTQILLPPLMLYAACGLVLSLAAHILSFFGIQFGGMPLFIGLHVGIFPLWIPVVFIAQKMMGGAQRKDFWKVALSGCPLWMRYMTYGFFIYAVVKFCDLHYSRFNAPACKRRRGASAGSTARILRPLDVVLFSGARNSNHGLSPGPLQFAAQMSVRSRNRLGRQVLSDMRIVNPSAARPDLMANLSCHVPRKRGIQYPARSIWTAAFAKCRLRGRRGQGKQP